MAWYSDEQWAAIVAVLRDAGARLSTREERDCRIVMMSAAETFSWLRRGLALKQARPLLRSVGSAIDLVGQLEAIDAGSPVAMRLAAKLERELQFIFKSFQGFEELVSAVDARNWSTRLVALAIELPRLVREIEREVARYRRPRPTQFHNWVSSLARIWEQSGLSVTAHGGFPRFVEAARVPGIRGGVITETSVRDFVLKKWKCRTPKSS